jgi:lipid-binding SYLF domain-containing protein
VLEILRSARVALALALFFAAAAAPQEAAAAKAANIDRDVNAAFEQLLASHAGAKAIAREALATLVFPKIVKGGFIFGGQFGDGAMRRSGRTTAYYRSVAASYGLQAGVQTFGYALFFMNQAALSYFEKSDGWEIGVGPSIVVLDKGLASSITTTTARSDVYAVFFDQKGLMAGIGLQGTKILRIHPD